MSRFDYSLDFDRIDFRQRPDLYRVGRGEQGVFHVQPYKDALLPHWRFKTPAVARESSEELYARFEAYLTDGDFVGADMARKYLQMGYTRARRYANHRGGRKYAPDGTVRPPDPDPEKAAAAEIFAERLRRAKAHPAYQRLRQEHEEKYP